MIRKRHGRGSDARTGKGKARERHDRKMPMKDMTELDQGRSGRHVLKQRLTIKLLRQDAVRASLWYVSKAVGLFDSKVETFIILPSITLTSSIEI